MRWNKTLVACLLGLLGGSYWLAQAQHVCSTGSCVNTPCAPSRITYGYYPTTWRRWPTDEPTLAPPSEPRRIEPIAPAESPRSNGADTVLPFDDERGVAPPARDFTAPPARDLTPPRDFSPPRTNTTPDFPLPFDLPPTPPREPASRIQPAQPSTSPLDQQFAPPARDETPEAPPSTQQPSAPAARGGEDTFPSDPFSPGRRSGPATDDPPPGAPLFDEPVGEPIGGRSRGRVEPRGTLRVPIDAEDLPPQMPKDDPFKDDQEPSAVRPSSLLKRNVSNHAPVAEEATGQALAWRTAGKAATESIETSGESRTGVGPSLLLPGAPDGATRSADENAPPTPLPGSGVKPNPLRSAAGSARPRSEPTGVVPAAAWVPQTPVYTDAPASTTARRNPLRAD